MVISLLSEVYVTGRKAGEMGPLDQIILKSPAQWIGSKTQTIKSGTRAIELLSDSEGGLDLRVEPHRNKLSRITDAHGCNHVTNIEKK